MKAHLKLGPLRGAAKWVWWCWVLLGALAAPAATPGQVFEEGLRAYMAGNYERAVQCFEQAAQANHSAGAYHNLGNAQWQCGRTGEAILAWERARSIDPYYANTAANLRFARRMAQLETPELAWHEICSAWLPANLWAWVAFTSFWLAAGLVILPGVLHWRKRDWHQGVAAVGFAIFLFVIPALCGVYGRSLLGVILTKQTPIRLTPTPHGQTMSRLNAGEIVRLERQRGNFLFVRSASDQAGWIERAQVGFICRASERLK